MPDQTDTGTERTVGPTSLTLEAPDAAARDQPQSTLIGMMAAPLASGTIRRRYIHAPGGVRLLIIDSRSLTRDCLVAAISHADGIGSIEAVSNVALALAKIGDNAAAPDAILVNFSTDPLSDDRLSALLGPLRAAAPDAGLLMLAASLDRTDVVAALRQGVSGLLDSDAPFELVIQAICLVASGLMIYPAFDLGPELLTQAGHDMDVVAEFRFTERQRQVLEELQHGHTNSMIATKLSVSERTVKAHVKELMRRLGATNRTQIVAFMSRGSLLQSLESISPARMAGRAGLADEGAPI